MSFTEQHKYWYIGGKNMKRRLLSLCLCLVLALSLLPMAALAADITQVTVYDIDHPVDGKTLDTSYTLPSNAGYMKQNGYPDVIWYDQGTDGFKSVKSYGATPSGTKLSYGATATAGHYYVAELRLERTGSYVFPKKSFSVELTEEMNMRAMDKQGWSENTTSSGYKGAVYLYYKADLVYGKFNPLSLQLNQSFTGSLIEGGTPWTAADLTNVSYFHTGADYDLTLTWKCGNRLLDAGEKFAKGYTYNLTLTFDAAKVSRHATFEYSGWEVMLNDTYSAVPSVTNNGLKAEAVFSFTCAGKISTLDITNIEVPTAGQPMQTSGFSASQGAKVKSAEWYKYIGSIDTPTSGNFEPKTSYYVQLTVAPPAGAAFQLSKSDVHAELGTVSSFTQLDSGEVVVCIRFDVGEVPVIQISEAAVSVNAPKLFELPVFLAAAEGAGYNVYPDDGASYIGGVCWMDVTDDSSLTDDLRVLKNHSGDPFKPGHVYEVLVELIAQDGYSFTDNTSVVINGETTGAYLQGDVLRASYTFAPLPILTGIQITNPPTKTEYTEGESFDPTGMIVTASFGSAYTMEVPVEDLMIEAGGPLIAMDTGVNIRYTAEGVTKSVFLPISVMKAKYLTTLLVSTEPAKTKYTEGEVFDPAGMVVTAVYSDDTVKTVTNYVYEPNGGLTLNDGIVTVSYTEDNTTVKTALLIEVTVKDKTLKEITIATPPAKTEYTEGNAFDPAGMTVTAFYTDGSSETITGYTVEPVGALKKDTTAITISYTLGQVTKNVQQPITVKAADKVLKSIAITTGPAKTEYKAGDSFDPAGMVVTASYDDQSSAAVTGYTLSPNGALTDKDTVVTVSYTEGDTTVTATVSITVKASGKTNPFVDVTEQDQFYDAVLWAYYAEPQVTNGIDTTHFGPYSTVTRGQAVTFLWRAMGCPEPGTMNNPFEDVKANEYYYKPILWAVEKGITIGTDATHFTPSQTCSTAHILTFLYRTMGIGTNGWYDVAGAWAQGAGLLKDLDIQVAPGVDCPRADVVLFLYRLLAN
jgi:hypothetical protein